jgi:hypothetical protein
VELECFALDEVAFGGGRVALTATLACPFLRRAFAGARVKGILCGLFGLVDSFCFCRCWGSGGLSGGRRLGLIGGIATATRDGYGSTVHVEFLFAIHPCPCKDDVAGGDVGWHCEVEGLRAGVFATVA